jgi:hypothetical protein
VPEVPPKLETPAFLGPNVTTEAEQVSKMLTGQPLATNVSIPQLNTTAAASSAVAAMQAAGLPSFSGGSTAAAAQGGAPPIVVTPSPLVVLSPPPSNLKKKPEHTSRLHRMFNRFGNRVSQAIPQ